MPTANWLPLVEWVIGLAVGSVTIVWGLSWRMSHYVTQAKADTAGLVSSVKDLTHSLDSYVRSNDQRMNDFTKWATGPVGPEGRPGPEGPKGIMDPVHESWVMEQITILTRRVTDDELRIMDLERAQSVPK